MLQHAVLYRHFTVKNLSQQAKCWQSTCGVVKLLHGDGGKSTLRGVRISDGTLGCPGHLWTYKLLTVELCWTYSAVKLWIYKLIYKSIVSP